jgi:hypothetical protein
MPKSPKHATRAGRCVIVVYANAKLPVSLYTPESDEVRTSDWIQRVYCGDDNTSEGFQKMMALNASHYAAFFRCGRVCRVIFVDAVGKLLSSL